MVLAARGRLVLHTASDTDQAADDGCRALGAFRLNISAHADGEHHPGRKQRCRGRRDLSDATPTRPSPSAFAVGMLREKRSVLARARARHARCIPTASAAGANAPVLAVLVSRRARWQSVVLLVRACFLECSDS